MKNLVLLLLLANIIFFAWNRWVADPVSDGATHFRETDLGPTLELVPRDASAPPAETAPDATDPASPGSAGETASARQAVAAIVGRPCVSIGPFDSNDAGKDAVGRLATMGNEATLRASQGEVFLGHWVQIRNIPTRAETERQLQVLRDNGIKDAYPVPEDDGERTISLGLFSELPRAERLELQAKSLGLDAEIVPHTREATVFWADTRLAPGQDVRALEQVFGEGTASVGDRAGCPRN